VGKEEKEAGGKGDKCDGARNPFLNAAASITRRPGDDESHTS
jgi:hypothetical protein